MLMARRIEFIPYRPKIILNKGKLADHWFWTRYMACPCGGCQHWCFSCYCGERRYCPFRDENELRRMGYAVAKGS